MFIPVCFLKVEMSIVDAPSTLCRIGNSAVPPGNVSVAVAPCCSAAGLTGTGVVGGVAVF
ncbi:hypothetical protein Q9Q99_18010 [Curtobacterium flaccumfaciens]|nr:hypothetical protein Q9Q99_18010 [Curtobacterium flaccumfaciens]